MQASAQGLGMGLRVTLSGQVALLVLARLTLLSTGAPCLCVSQLPRVTFRSSLHLMCDGKERDTPLGVV